MKRRERAVAVATAELLLLVTGVSLAQVIGPDAMMKGIEFTRVKVI